MGRKPNNAMAKAIQKAQEEAKRRAQEEANRRAQENAARRAQEDAARRAQEDAARRAQEEANRRTQEASAAKKIKQPHKNIPSLPTGLKKTNSISTFGSQIQKQKKQVENNLKILKSHDTNGAGLLAGVISSFNMYSNNEKKKNEFSKENRTSVKNMYVIIPDANTNKKYIKNPDYKQFVKDYGCQIVPYKFYNKDTQLTEYEKFFNDNKSACVPMALAVNYFRQIQNNDE